jgi:hypothetical protein
MNRDVKQNKAIRWRNLAALAVCAFGFTTMLGDVLQIPALKGIGLASTIAPCPKVFCDAKGMEAFASEFILKFETNRQKVEVPLTPELYSKLKGPYNRRNVYGAALSFAPRLPEPLWRSAFAYALAENGPLRRELGISPDATNLVVVIQTKTRGRNDRWELQQP